MKTIQEFNYSNTLAITINHALKMKILDILRLMKYDNTTICIQLQNYENVSYRIVPVIQQGIFNDKDIKDIAQDVHNILNNSKTILLYPNEIETIINKYIKIKEKE
jgi:hypothetical protein